MLWANSNLEASLLLALLLVRCSNNFQLEACVQLGSVRIDQNDCVFFLSTGLERRSYNCQNLEPKKFLPEGHARAVLSTTEIFFWANKQNYEAFYHVAPRFGDGLETRRFPGNLSKDTEIDGYIMPSGTVLTRSKKVNNETRYLVDGEEIFFSLTREGDFLPSHFGQRKSPPFFAIITRENMLVFRYNLGRYFARCNLFKSISFCRSKKN